jgi:CRP/FNR family cyclic AMP-dependent transcriptional regulator
MSRVQMGLRSGGVTWTESAHAIEDNPMSSIAVSLRESKTLEDALEYLPRAAVIAYCKGEVIYSRDQTATEIYLVIGGSVKVCRPTGQVRQSVIDIYCPDELFGESALLGMALTGETANAFESATVMKWTAQEIEEIAMRRPQLAIALLQCAVRRSMDFTCRIESFAVDDIPRRLAHAIMHFSTRFGHQIEDGSIEMIPFTHEILAQYVGTSRELVTHHMSDFRRLGYLRYSRRGIWLYREAMADWLKAGTARKHGTPGRWN